MKDKTFSIHALDERTAVYSDPIFDAENAARRLFASSTEAELNKKVNDLIQLRSASERILKKEVHSNYKLFLRAHDDFHKVRLEINDTEHLIEQTFVHLQNVRNSRQPTDLNENENEISKIEKSRSLSTRKSNKDIFSLEKKYNLIPISTTLKETPLSLEFDIKNMTNNVHRLVKTALFLSINRIIIYYYFSILNDKSCQADK